MKSTTNTLPGTQFSPVFFSVRNVCGISVHLRAAAQERIALIDLEQLREEEATLLLSEEEQRYFQRFRYPKRRREWLGGRIAAKAALLNLYEPEEFRRQAQQLTILPDAHGRPAVSGAADSGLSLSISHSGSYAAALAGRGNSCGIDLQEISAKILPLASRFASSAELELLARQPGLGSQEARLTMLWAVKEAMKKSVLADQPVLFAGIEAMRIAAAGDRAWRFDCAVQGCLPQTAAVYDFAPYLLALTAQKEPLPIFPLTDRLICNMNYLLQGCFSPALRQHVQDVASPKSMAKIRRNQPCPCGSGSKHKHCCLPLQQAGVPPAPRRQRRLSLLGEIETIQQAAVRFQETFRELGVFVLFSMKNGDAWVLEVTDRDAVQVAAAGRPLPPPVSEGPELIEADWSHTFAFRERRLLLTAYQDGAEAELAGAPATRISAAVRRIMRQHPAELLGRVHLRTDEAGGAA